MTDWKQKIEAQMQALLDVAVAADTYLVDVQNDESEQALFDALDKLKEMSNED